MFLDLRFNRIIEKITNFVCDNFNIADYPSLNRFLDVKQLDVENIYNGEVLYRFKLRLKRNSDITINILEDYREVIERIVERPIKYEIIDYKNIYIDVLYLEQEKEGENIMIENIKKYEFIPTVEFEKSVDLDLVKYTFIEGEKEGVKATIGYDMQGNLKTFDILEGHTAVLGASRWGKSNFLNVFITNIMLTYTDKEIRLLGCDYKKSDIYYFRKYKHFKSVSTNKKEFLEQINALEKEMNRRAKILEEANCRNAIKYNKKNDNKLSYIIFIIDELVQLTTDKECSLKLHQLMSKCASYGIYVIIASQDYTKESIGKCKMNISQIVGFHTQDKTDSVTAIGEGYNLHDIEIVGRCYMKNREGINEVQTMYIDEDEMEELLKENLKQ